MNERNRALCAAFIEWHSKRSKPLSTYQYAATLEKLCAHAGAQALDTLSVDDVERFIYRVNERNGQPRADSTMSRDRTIVSCLYDWAVTRGHAHANPAAQAAPITVHNHHPKAIPDDLWITLWTNDSLTDAERVVLGLGFFCGLRREEMCRLEGRHFVGEGTSTDGSTVPARIVGFPRKGDRNNKVTGVLPIGSCVRLFHERRPDLGSDRLIEPLSKLIAQASACDTQSYLLPWAEQRRPRRPDRPGPPRGMTDPDAINRRLKRLCERLRLDAQLLTPHCFRHSFVTNLLKLGVPILSVSQLANHSSVVITQRYNRAVEDPLAEFLGRGPMDNRTTWGTYSEGGSVR